MRILFSFTLLFAVFTLRATAQDAAQEEWPDQPVNITKNWESYLPSVTCVHKRDKVWGNDWVGSYYNDWGVLQREEVYNQSLALRQVITCQNRTSATIVGISAVVAQVNATDLDNLQYLDSFPLRQAGNVDASSSDITCSTMNLVPGEYVKNVGIKSDDTLGVQSLVFYTTGGQIFGTGAPGNQQGIEYIQFQANDQMIGFYGTANKGTNLMSIGFLSYREECRKYNPTERGLAITGAVFLTILVLILIAGCCCGLPIFACCYVKKRRPDLVNKVKVPQAVKKMMQPKDANGERGKIVPDSSMAADIEMTDNNIDDKSGIMTEDAPKGGKK